MLFDQRSDAEVEVEPVIGFRFKVVVRFGRQIR